MTVQAKELKAGDLVQFEISNFLDKVQSVVVEGVWCRVHFQGFLRYSVFRSDALFTVISRGES